MPGPAVVIGFIVGIWFAALGVIAGIVSIAARGRWSR